MSNHNTIPNGGFQMVAEYEGDVSSLLKPQKPDIYPLICTRDLVLYPAVLAPIVLGRKESVTLARQLTDNPDTIFAIFCQRSETVEHPKQDDLYPIGVFARIVKGMELPVPNGRMTIIVQCLGRCKLERLTASKPFYQGLIYSMPEAWPGEEDETFHVTHDMFYKNVLSLIHTSEDIPNEAEYAINNISDPLVQTNNIFLNLPFSVEEKYNLLAQDNMTDRLLLGLNLLDRALQLAQLQSKIRQKTKNDLDQQQREYFLQQQLKNIKAELHTGGDITPERQELLDMAKKKKWDENVQKIFQKEYNKLDSIFPQSPDYSIQINYLRAILDLPWNEYTEDDLSLKHAKRVLDRDHYGMEKVKERILEYLAVRSLRGDMKSPILCLYGPPGVGKTSLGRSIAEAMNRKYVRVSLGGLHDESEIRGHRRTYIGAMPGRIIKSIQKAGSCNPVFILDEIDKIGRSTYNGDPSSAMLEVLDPEQNKAFHDNYLDMDYDLSKVLFIATANDLSGIPRPLLDRMELIEVSGYITEEKIEIAKRHLVPRELDNTGLKTFTPKIKFTKSALEDLIEHYTRESGVRQLEKQINKALRKLAYKLAFSEELEKTTISPTEVEELLGKHPFNRDIYQGNDYAGVVTGLAWTSVGGEILFIETSLSKGKAGKLTLTGNLGDVMKESAVIALEYVKAHVDLLDIDYRIFDNWNIHIHVPEGATPKDGPSAGITIATSIASALTQRKVRKNTAMTGEITLRGKVLPVGGIKEKILAAKRAGITDIMMCKDNRKDVEEIPEQYRKGLEFHYVETVADVWSYALTSEKVAHPIDFTVKQEPTKKEEKAS